MSLFVCYAFIPKVLDRFVIEILSCLDFVEFVWYRTMREEYVRIVADGVLQFLPTPWEKGVSLCMYVWYRDRWGLGNSDRFHSRGYLSAVRSLIHGIKLPEVIVHLHKRGTNCYYVTATEKFLMKKKTTTLCPTQDYNLVHLTQQSLL